MSLKQENILLTLDRLNSISLPAPSLWLLSGCMESKGKQDLWLKQKPHLLTSLREQSEILSIESSNRIEGVEVEPERLRPILLDKSKPKDRPEEELVAYQSALRWVYSHVQDRPAMLTIKSVQHLHKLAQFGAGDAGLWKRKDNTIIQRLPNGEIKTIFKPTSAQNTAVAMKKMCDEYASCLDVPDTPALLLIAVIIFDFLCIHPFRDGNGRVSRILTTMLLLNHGFEVPRYVSLEKWVEDHKESYYQVLNQCSQDWQNGKNEIIPWCNFFFRMIKDAYQTLQAQVELKGTIPAKKQMIIDSILAQMGPFTLGDIVLLNPNASTPFIKKVLGQLKSQGKVAQEGRGRGSRWRVLG